MARRKRKSSGGGEGGAWLVTFSDLMTLLLTFFVLLLSMSSMDTTVITRITSHVRSISPIALSGPGRLNERISLVVASLKDPLNIINKQKRIKDLLFPQDVLPPDITFGELDKNLSLLAHPEGVVIVLTDSLLFASGASTLGNSGKKLLDQLTPVMHALNADINISGHTSLDLEQFGLANSGAYNSNDELSFLRAASVLEHFMQAKMAPQRFSVSGYGSDKPLFPNETIEGQRKNRRVEILVKTTPRIGRYQ